MTNSEYKERIEAYENAVNDFEIECSGGISWVYSRTIRDAGARHGLTLRHGGVSEYPYDTLNLGWNRPESKENIKSNYLALSNAAGFAYDSMALVKYEHGDGVEVANDSDRGKGFGIGEFPPCDALISDSNDVTLITLHADCIPVFLFDPKRRSIGMVHAGWQGVSKKIGQKTALKMISEFNCSGNDILAAIGPSISRDRFEVDEPVANIFKENFPGLDCLYYSKSNGKYYIDLWLAMFSQLMDAGINPKNISVSRICTYDCLDYFSYRRDKRMTGAMAGFIGLT